MTTYRLDNCQFRRQLRLLLALLLLLLLTACGMPQTYISSPPLVDASPGTGGTLPPLDLPPDDARRTVLAFAFAQLGEPYTQWPNNPALSCGRGSATCTRDGPDCWDCSGFTRGAYRQVGVELGPTTFYQIDNGVAVGLDMAAWAPGDLMLYCDANGPYHVAMYAGNGMMIHAANCDAGVISNPVYTDSLCSVRRLIAAGG
jgi:cell wall-associated NlpC family hydrolase